jgi:hypothetical protein
VVAYTHTAAVAAIRAGSAWLELCQGTADAALVPLLLPAALQAGSAADVAALQEAQKALAADRNIALDDLARVSAQPW